MRVLLVDGFDGVDPAVDAAIDVLESRGHEVIHRDLEAEGFTVAMSTAERRAYHDEGENLLSDATRSAAATLPEVDALLFCVPQTTFGLPARTKAFLDRVFIPGVAFTFDDAGKLVPRLRHIRRVGLVVRTPHDAATVRRVRDGARRYVLWTVRLNCSWRCRRTHVRLRPGDTTDAVVRALRRW